MKQSLQLRLGQQLRLTPQLQQAIRFLQLSAVELEHELQKALENNPLLEVASSAENNHSENADSNEGFDNPQHPNSQQSSDQRSNSDDIQPISLNDNTNQNSDTSQDYSQDSDQSWDDYSFQKSSSQQHNSQSNWDFLAEGNSQTESLQDKLRWQLNLSDLNPNDRLMAEYIIDSVAPNGRLSLAPLNIFESIKELKHSEEQVEFDEFEAVRHLIQQFSPVGCASFDLQECLMAQVTPRNHPKDIYKTTQQLLSLHLELLGLHDIEKLSRLTHIKESLLNKCLAVIKTLDPYPGERVGEAQTDYIVPDVVAYRNQGQWKIKLNDDHVSTLQLNENYVKMLSKNDNAENKSYLKEHLNDAKNLIQSLDNRNQTLFNVSSLIVDVQKDFFDQGASAMKPLTQQSIAERVGMHESTISRITTQKYILTPRGIFELKYFFSSQVGNHDNLQSSTAVQSMIKELIASENSQKPLSDTKIGQWLLEKKGINIARRTVAKYREQLSIPSSSERKKYFK